MQKGRAFLPAPKASLAQAPSAFDDVDDLVGLRTHDDVAAVHQHHFIAAPLRIDFHNPLRQRVEANRRRDRRANRDVEVHIGGFLDPLRLDGGNDLGALLGRRGCGRRGGGVAGGGLRIGAGCALALGILVAGLTFPGLGVLVAGLTFAGLGVLVAGLALAGLGVLVARLTFAALGVRVSGLAVATFGLHVLAALGRVIVRAHALGLLTFHLGVLRALGP